MGIMKNTPLGNIQNGSKKGEVFFLKKGAFITLMVSKFIFIKNSTGLRCNLQVLKK